MEKKHLHIVSSAACVLMGVVALSLGSCVDNDYDLTEDIDFTIQVGGSDFAIPGGETEAIRLSKLLKVEEDDLVKIADNGDYYLLQDGTSKHTAVTVDNFYIDEPDIDPVVKSLDFGIPAVGMPDIGAGNEELSATLPTGDDAFMLSYELRNSSTMPEEIKSISRVDVDLVARIAFSYSPGFAQNLYLDDITIDLPDYFIVGETLESGNVKRISNEVIEDYANYVVEVAIVGVDLTQLPEGEGFDSSTLSFNLSGDIVVNGTVHINSGELLVSDGSTNISVDLVADAYLSDIHVQGMQGRIDPDIDVNVEPISLSGLPDFLNDEEVVLDVANPQIYFFTNNQTPVRALITSSNLVSIYQNGGENVVVNLPELSVAPLTYSEFCLSPVEPEGFDGIYEPVENLSALVERIPNQIEVNLFAEAADEETEIRLGEEYYIDTDYEINVPFAFGPNLTIVYRDTVDGWREDIEDYEITQVNVTATVENKIPLDLHLTATALTTDGVNALPLDGVTAVVRVPSQDNDDIKANSTTDIVIEIVEETPGQVKQLDGLALRVTADGSSEVSADNRILNSNQTLQLRNVKLKVPGGVKIDLN